MIYDVEALRALEAELEKRRTSNPDFRFTRVNTVSLETYKLERTFIVKPLKSRRDGQVRSGGYVLFDFINFRHDHPHR